jgi:NDP-sugar pyrophosphorylase family protein
MKAMIMAAGLGTRLKPITEQIPKALVEYEGITLLEHAIIHLRLHGADKIIVNVHHFADQVIDFLKKNDFEVDIEVSDESGDLLETGGGLRKAAWFFDDQPFFVRNVDVISDLDLTKLMGYHLDNKSLATLAVRKRETSRYFLFDDQHNLCGWKNVSTGETIWCGNEVENAASLAFSGIQVIDPTIFPLITETGKFSLTTLYLRLAREHRIKGFEEPNRIWMDIGKPENLKKKLS